MWKAVFVVLGALTGWIVVWFGSWPGLALFGVQMGHAKDFRVCVALGVLVLSLHGFWLGSVLDARAGRATSPLKWKAVFAVFGALFGVVIGGFGSMVVFSALGLKGKAVEALAWLLAMPAAAAASCALGFRLGSLLDGRAGRQQSPHKWKALFAALGAAIGPVAGSYAVIAYVNAAMRGDCMRGLAAVGMVFVQGAPIGSILLCLLGFCVGSAMDERRRGKDSRAEGPRSA